MRSRQAGLPFETRARKLSIREVRIENFLIFFIEKLRQLTHVVGTLSHKGIARRALPASGGKDVVGGKKK